MKKILVLNAGSSSLKYQLIAMPSKEVIAKGLVEKIGTKQAGLVYKANTFVKEECLPIENHREGLSWVVDQLLHPEFGVIQSASEIAAVGHRVVHGGSTFSDTTLITEAFKDKIKQLYPLAPLHNPANMEGIEVAQQLFPQTPQVAVFDTAFYQSLEEKVYRFAIDKELADQERIRVYGFHGTSHKYVSEQTAAYLNKPSAKLIVLHLGNGCSATAIADGKSVEHSMGFGPISGLIMGTRSGDIDPAVLLYLQQSLGYSAEEVKTLLTKNSGLQGLAGVSDMRELHELNELGNEDAKLALAMNAHRVKKYIGSFLAVLNGADAIVFTAGIGENDKRFRAAVCADLEGLGIVLDPKKNQDAGSGIAEIQAKASKLKILVVPTDEELEIAKQSYQLILED